MASPTFWSMPGADPKRRYRFTLNVPSAIGGVVPIWTIKTVNKPKANVSVIEHQYLNHTFKYPGRVTWDNITMTLVDPEDPDLAQSWLKKLNASGYQSPDQTNQQGTNPSTIGKQGAATAVGQILIRQMNESGKIVEEWTLFNPWIVSIDFGGQLDYTSDEMSEITVEIAYDWADLKGRLLHQAWEHV